MKKLFFVEAEKVFPEKHQHHFLVANSFEEAFAIVKDKEDVKNIGNDIIFTSYEISNIDNYDIIILDEAARNKIYQEEYLKEIKENLLDIIREDIYEEQLEDLIKHLDDMAKWIYDNETYDDSMNRMCYESILRCIRIIREEKQNEEQETKTEI